MEEYDLHIVSSTRDLLREKQVSTGSVAVLMGNPRFALTIEEERAELQNLHLQQIPEVQESSIAGNESLNRGLAREENCPNRPHGGVLCPLPRTETEVVAIQGLLQGYGWQTEPAYIREKALKEVLKRVRHPRVLHIATHGFFWPDQRIEPRDQLRATEDPMLRSGLFLAGADRVLNGETTPPDLENGVLTAFEASSLNLQGTELVVLSACETGLGQVKSGEGVFGLRRAFQEAGAEAVLMSLWSVPDRETQELMTLFYQRWLSSGDKHVALREAQLEMRNRVKERYGRDIPWYWGGFVLAGQ